jgi:hypothetical protein
VKELVKLQVELSKQPWEHCLMRAALYSNRGRMPLALVRAEKTLWHLEELTCCPCLDVKMRVPSWDVLHLRWHVFIS